MSDWKQYLPENYKETYDYASKVWRGGLSSFPPAIVTCAITGGNAGKEINPNLPELIDEQVQQTYDAYKAGASMVHIHRRDPDNPCAMTQDPELYKEVNKKIREKCPDIIINNTAAGGRFRMSETELSPMMLASVYADPEIASLDVTNYCSITRMPPRKPPLFGREEEQIREMSYCISHSETQQVIDIMKAHKVKPEFECFNMSDIFYVNKLLQAGYQDVHGGPHLVQFVFTPSGSNWPTLEYMVALKGAVPKGCQFGVIAAGAQQFPILTLALIQGFHVRVGMEDNVYIERGKLAESNAQLVEKIVKIAELLDRPVATPTQAREMLGLGEPRTW